MQLSFNVFSLDSIKSITSRLVKLTRAERCASNKLLFGCLWLHMRFDRLRSFEVSDFCTYRKPLISCDPSISPRFWEIALPIKLKTTPILVLAPSWAKPFDYCQTYNVKSWGISLLFGKNHVILASVVFSQYSRVSDKQTDKQTDKISWQWPNFAMQLQHSAKNQPRIAGVMVENTVTHFYGSWGIFQFGGKLMISVTVLLHRLTEA